MLVALAPRHAFALGGRPHDGRDLNAHGSATDCASVPSPVCDSLDRAPDFGSNCAVRLGGCQLRRPARPTSFQLFGESEGGVVGVEAAGGASGAELVLLSDGEVSGGDSTLPVPPGSFHRSAASSSACSAETRSGQGPPADWTPSRGCAPPSRRGDPPVPGRHYSCLRAFWHGGKVGPAGTASARIPGFRLA